MYVTPDTHIVDLLDSTPGAVDILQEAGMHCFGCPAAHAETIREACEVHGIKVEELLDKLNK